MKKLPFIIIPLTLSLILAGCGGGGSSTPAKQPGKIVVTNQGIK